MNKNFTLCLNMIVKNESHIIISTLTNICDKISFDYWIICDTGSTDNTKELIIEFFKLRNISGELYENKWVDFGYNRTIALENAYNKTDYLFIFDADDTLEGNLVFPTNLFDYDSYLLNYGKYHTYSRKQIINNRKKWKYVGVLHEYIECLEKDNYSSIIGDYYIVSGKSGNRSNDINKYYKDAILLEEAYYEAYSRQDTICERYSFYCANSYKDSNNVNNAIKWYKNTLLLNNWNQEKYMSCLNLYYLYNSINKTEKGIFYLIKSYEYDKSRIEGIYNLIKYYCVKKQFEIAFYFYTFIQNYYENDYVNETFNDKLFVDKIIYSFYLPYYMIIICEELKKYDLGLKIINILFIKDELSEDSWWINNIIFNLQFFLDKNKDIHLIKKWDSFIKRINSRNITIDRDLINKYEIQNITNFLQCYKSNTKDTTYDNESYVVLAILAKDKEFCLEFYLQCIYNQSYNKEYIHLYIRTNDNNDSTQDILIDFINKYGHEYASVYYDDTDISEEIKKYSNHEWNVLRFHILSKIRQDSIEHAIKLNSHYFVVDCDNFIIPYTLEKLMKNKNMGVLAPMLKCGYNESINYDLSTKNNICNNINYSNYHYEVDKNGYYQENNKYYSIINYDVTGLIRVCCVHCVYLIPNKFLSSVCYNDNSNRYEYVILSESLRKYSIPQYIDNTEKYGYLTFVEDKELFKIENNYWKTKLFK